MPGRKWKTNEVFVSLQQQDERAINEMFPLRLAKTNNIIMNIEQHSLYDPGNRGGGVGSSKKLMNRLECNVSFCINVFRR